jgi:hypothetical protein
MADSLALSGLASGVDTSSIVSQLMALDRRPATPPGPAISSSTTRS